MDDVKYLNIPDTAERFGVHFTTIYRYIKDGRIRAVRAGARYMVELASVRPYFSDTPEVREILEIHGGVRHEVPAGVAAE